MRTNRALRFRDPWWISLPPIEKLILDYIAENCNQGGVIEFVALDWEYALGLQKMPEQWYHEQNPGVIYATKALALDDVERLGMPDTMIRRRAIADWPKIWETINTPPKGMLDKIIPQVVKIGDSKLWYPRFIERYMRQMPDGTGGTVGKIRLDEHQLPHRKVVKILRKEALISSIKEFYAPNIEIVEAPSGDELQSKMTLENRRDEFLPELDKALECKEKSSLTQEQVRIWFFQNQQTDYKDCRIAGWKDSLQRFAADEATKAAYMGMLMADTGVSKWPVEGERAEALEWIAETILKLNQQRTPSDSGPVLTPEAQASIKILQRAQALIERERAE